MTATDRHIHQLAAEIDRLRRGLREIISQDTGTPGRDTTGWDNIGDVEGQAADDAWHAAAEIARSALEGADRE